MPSWADAIVAIIPYYKSNTGDTGEAQLGTAWNNAGNSDYPLTGDAGVWYFAYTELSALSNTRILLGTYTGAYTYYDNIMFGFAIDLDVYFEKWNPVDRTKKEERDTPYNVLTQLYSDALDLKAETIKFDTTLRQKIIGAWQYLQKGHYFGCILDRGHSAPYRDEWMPYLSLDSQDTPKFYAGAPGVHTMGINGRGCLP